MKNFYKCGYLKCIEAIKNDATKHKSKITFETLIKQLDELAIVKDVELNDDVELSDAEDISKTMNTDMDSAILKLMSDDGSTN
jgi:ribosomal protein S8